VRPSEARTILSFKKDLSTESALAARHEILGIREKEEGEGEAHSESGPALSG
jgi:hypothetical protein